METYVTPNGKEIQIINAAGTGHYKVQFAKGGELPAELDGLFTSSAVAEIAVRNYLLNNKTRLEKKAENKEFEEQLKKSVKKKQTTEE